MIVREEDNGPGPVLFGQFRKTEETGGQALADGRGSLDLIACSDARIKGGQSLVQLLIAVTFGIRNVIDGIIFFRIGCHEFFLGGEIGGQGLQPLEREFIIIRHRNVAHT